MAHLGRALYRKGSDTITRATDRVDIDSATITRAADQVDIGEVNRFIDEAAAHPLTQDLLITEALITAGAGSTIANRIPLRTEETSPSIHTLLASPDLTRSPEKLSKALVGSLISYDSSRSPADNKADFDDMLRLAAVHGCINVMKILIQQYPDLIDNSSIFNALQQAIVFNHPNMVSLLTRDHPTKITNYDIIITLAQAAVHGHYKLADILIHEVKRRGIWDQAALSNVLITAAQAGHLHILQALCGNYGESDFPSSPDDNRLKLTSWSDDDLCPPVISFPQESINRALTEAVKQGHYDAARFLIGQGANNLDKALTKAAKYGHLDLADLLIAQGANHLNSALTKAAQYGHFYLAKFLIAQGANHLNSALIQAAQHGHLDLANFLIARGAPIDLAALQRAPASPDRASFLAKATFISRLEAYLTKKHASTAATKPSIPQKAKQPSSLHFHQRLLPSAKARGAHILLESLRNNASPRDILKTLHALGQDTEEFSKMCASWTHTSEFKTIHAEMLRYYTSQYPEASAAGLASAIDSAVRSAPAAIYSAAGSVAATTDAVIPRSASPDSVGSHNTIGGADCPSSATVFAAAPAKKPDARGRAPSH